MSIPKGSGKMLFEAEGAKKWIFADMHTHSESSHDSVCKIEDMLLAQRARGAAAFAATDHFDTDSYDKMEIFAPIVAASKTVAALNAHYGGIPLVLSGIEISEGFWHMSVYERVMKLVDYDVVIGSVHLVKYRDLTYAYSKIDFSALDEQTVLAYLDAYFDDVLTMLDTLDFDVLAHLTCPLRYINGKYRCGITLERYAGKIQTILQKIIEKGIALEVNTSFYGQSGDFMPGVDVIARYYAMGGRLITLGSDAHVPENASCHFAEAIAAIKKIGFDRIYYYKNRKPQEIRI